MREHRPHNAEGATHGFRREPCRKVIGETLDMARRHARDLALAEYGIDVSTKMVFIGGACVGPFRWVAVEPPLPEFLNC